MSSRTLFNSFIIVIAASSTVSLCAIGRTTISLNGKWQIEDSRDADAMRAII